ncbi:hypothetical protein BaRGS_00038059 [Batillaria attramentaria]|uniref:Uncharacterized protein n=1 Tax=Batillaria attramentaria TaxID=370345 RepID=A0ABD0J787_9CAEN
MRQRPILTQQSPDHEPYFSRSILYQQKPTGRPTGGWCITGGRDLTAIVHSNHSRADRPSPPHPIVVMVVACCKEKLQNLQNAPRARHTDPYTGVTPGCIWELRQSLLTARLHGRMAGDLMQLPLQKIGLAQIGLTTCNEWRPAKVPDVGRRTLTFITPLLKKKKPDWL